MVPALTQAPANFQASEAFPAAKSRIKEYFEHIIGVDGPRIADLFDSTESADNQDKRISEFIKIQVDDNVQDLFIYYVGHGSFTSSENTFYLAINRTRQNSAAVSSLTIPTHSRIQSKVWHET